MPGCEASSFAPAFSFSASLKPRTRSTLVSEPLTHLDDDDVALAAQRLEQEARGLAPEAVIVGADEGEELAAGGAVGDVDNGDLGFVDLLNPRHHRLVVDRREDDGARLLHHDVFDLAELFWDRVRLGRNVLQRLRVQGLRHVVGADPHRLEERVGLVLGEDGDGLAVGANLGGERGRHQQRQRQIIRQVTQFLIHVVSIPLILLVGTPELIARGGGSSCRARPRE
ncbi:hypothetical protein ACVWWK_006701 [Bradyrhizobium sp. LB9.1b]